MRVITLRTIQPPGTHSRDEDISDRLGSISARASQPDPRIGVSVVMSILPFGLQNAHRVDQALPDGPGNAVATLNHLAAP
jgi:hypothetical protein